MLSEDDIVLKEIGEIVEKYSRDDDLLYYYDRDEMFRNDVKRIYKKRITEEVTDKVTKSNMEEVARKMKEEGSDITFITKITGLSKKEIELL